MKTITGIASQDGITIAADDVTLDLMGFTLLGVATSGNGISVSGQRKNITVGNGIVRGWGSAGVNLVNLSDGANYLLEHLVVSSNSVAGINVGRDTTVSHCSAFNNAGPGIGTGVGCRVADCVANFNTGIIGFGIATGGNSTVRNCFARQNSQHGISLSGAGDVTGCAALGNSGDGIAVLSGATIRDCSVYGNLGNGISVVGNGARVEGDNIVANGLGLSINSISTGGGNLVIRNSLRGNTASYFFSANTMNGPPIAITDITTSSNSHANYIVP